MEIEIAVRGLTPQMVRDFVATYDRNDPEDRRIVVRLIERTYGELYRRERKLYSEWIDLGGEGGEG